MSEFGPLPEQPFVDWLIPTMDLRDAIRRDHGLEPFYEEEVVERRPIDWDIWVPAIAALSLLIAWAVYPAAALGVIVVSFIIVRFVR